MYPSPEHPDTDSGPITAAANADSWYNDSVASGAALLEIADSHSLKLSPRDVSIFAGFDNVHGLGRLGVFRHAREKRIDGAMAVLYQEALETDVEFDQARMVSDWLLELTDDEVASIDVVPDAHVDDVYLTRMKLTTGEKALSIHQSFRFLDAPKVFPIKDAEGAYTGGTVASKLAFLPDHVKDYFGRKQQFWQSLGVDTGPGIYRFLDEHFETFQLTPTTIPAEIQWLINDDPELTTKLIAASKQFYMRRLRNAPAKTISAVRTISQSQNRLSVDWLEDMLLRDIRPTITDDDHQMYLDNHTEAVAKIDGLNSSEYVKNVQKRSLGTDVNAKTDFETAISSVANLHELTLGLNVDIDASLLDEKLTADLNDLNGHLDNTIGRELALRSILKTSSEQNADGAKKIIIGIFALIAAAEGMNQIGGLVPSLSWLKDMAYMLAASEDAASTVSDSTIQLREGHHAKDIIKGRAGILAAIATGNLYLGSQVEHITAIAGPRIGALALAASASLTTATTTALNIKTAADAYERQVTSGKVQGHMHVEDKATKKRIKQIIASDAPADMKFDSIRSMLLTAAQPGIDEHTVDSVMDNMRLPIGEQRGRAVMRYMSISKKQKYTAGWREAIDRYPLRSGKTAGVGLMLSSAPLLGKWLLRSPIIYIPFSTLEPIVGLLNSKKHETGHIKFWEKWINEDLREHEVLYDSQPSDPSAN